MRRRRTAVRKEFAARSLLAASAILLAGCTGEHRANGLTGPTLRVLQLNLCNSGLASCYTGHAVTAAAAVIAGERPDIVTLNEICRDDVSELQRAMSAAHSGMSVKAAFKAALDRPTSGPYKCSNGQDFGIGVLTVVPVSVSVSADRTFSGVYPTQDLTDPEERVWLCIHAKSAFYACTTHTASTSTAIAISQCRYFLRSVVSTLRSEGGNDPVILGADLNLLAHRSPDPQSCLPAGYQRADDGARQDVVTSAGLAVRSRLVINMHGTTDHPGLLVELARSTH